MRKNRLLAFLTTICLCVPAPVHAKAPEVQVKISEKLEALLLLDVLAGGDPLLEHLGQVAALWHGKLDGNPAAKEAVDSWKGAGRALCCLLADVGGEDPAGLLAALATPDEMLKKVEAGLDHPELRVVLERLKKDHAKLKAYVQALQDNGFHDFWDQALRPELETRAPRAAGILVKIEAEKLKAALTPFVGAAAAGAPVEPYLTALSGGRSFRLSGAKVSLGMVYLEMPPVEIQNQLCRELCGRFTLSEKILANLRALGAGDEYYAKARARIYGEFKYGEEEEILIAVNFHAAVAAGIMSRKQALRGLKYALTSPTAQDQFGAPVASILFGELDKSQPTGDVDFVHWLEERLDPAKLAPGTVKARTEEALAEVLGVGGFSVKVQDGKVMIALVTPGSAVAEAGMLVGDELTAAAGTPVVGAELMQAMEILAGRRGDARVVTIRRGDKTVEIKYTLR